MSSIKPIGDRVLVELLPEENPAGQIVAAPTANKEGFQPHERGVVRAIGTRCQLPLKPGDEVLVFTNHGMSLPRTEAKLFFSPHVVAIKENHE